MDWTALTRQELDAMIASGLAEYDEVVGAEWARIRIEPEKWRCSPWGDRGGGFWAVAIDAGQVLWFNDIEDGFNLSKFSERGVIDEYWCNQDDFTHVIERIAQQDSERRWASLVANVVPADLRGPGTIVRRQTTYWELRADAGALYRVDFRDKAETGFATADYLGVELVARHPLLIDHDEPSRNLYFSGTPRDSGALAEAVDQAIRELAGGWRGLASYAGRGDGARRKLQAGHGLLMDAPESVCAAAAAVLDAAGVSTSILGLSPGRPGKRVLALGRSYVIAGAFAFARRG